MSHDHCCNGSCHCHDHHHHDESNCCHHHHHGQDDFAHQLLELADEAWMEVLKEKIKEEIHKHNGKNLEELAKLVASSNNNRWKNKLGLQHSCSDFRRKIADFFDK